MLKTVTGHLAHVMSCVQYLLYMTINGCNVQISTSCNTIYHTELATTCLSDVRIRTHTGHLFQPTAAWDLGRARTIFINNVTPNSKQRHHKL